MYVLCYLRHVYSVPFSVICTYFGPFVLTGGIFSDLECCDTILVQGGGDAMEKQPGIYHSFVLEADLLNGHMHYTSQDETMALTYNTGNKQWNIQEAANR